MKIKAIETSSGNLMGHIQHKIIETEHEYGHNVPFDTFYVRTEAVKEKDGEWAAHLLTTQLEGIKSNEDLELDMPEWQRSEKIGTFPTSQQALETGFRQMKDYFSSQEEKFRERMDPHGWAEEKDERTQYEHETRHISVSTGKLSYDEEKGTETRSAVIVRSDGLFDKTGIDNYGNIPYDTHTVYTSVSKNNATDSQKEYPHTTNIIDIPYETGQKRPDRATMKRNFSNVDGNLIDYADTSQIGLVDAVRDGLHSGSVSLKTPLVQSIMEQRILDDLGTPYTEDPIIETTAGLQMLLKSAQRKQGLDVTEDLMKLSAIQETHVRGTQPNAKEAASVYKILNQAEKLGLDFSETHKNAARLGLISTQTEPVKEIEKTRTVQTR
jgi:hypothetical protein